MRIREYEVYGDIANDITIAVVADMHGFPGETVVDKLKQRTPDLIAIVGDLVDSKRPYSNGMQLFLTECSEIAQTYMSLGNHDYVLSESDYASIRDTGVIILDNAWIEINPLFYIGGLTSAYVLKCRQYGEESNEIVLSDLKWLNEFAKIDGYKILLDHHPENYLIYTKSMPIDLILSGHTHGGQISILGYGLYAPHQKLCPRYIGGIYDDKLVVSRGLSNTSWLPRIGNPTELVFVRIKTLKEGN